MKFFYNSTSSDSMNISFISGSAAHKQADNEYRIYVYSRFTCWLFNLWPFDTHLKPVFRCDFELWPSLWQWCLQRRMLTDNKTSLTHVTQGQTRSMLKWRQLTQVIKVRPIVLLDLLNILIVQVTWLFIIITGFPVGLEFKPVLNLFWVLGKSLNCFPKIRRKVWNLAWEPILHTMEVD